MKKIKILISFRFLGEGFAIEPNESLKRDVARDITPWIHTFDEKFCEHIDT